jgi:hypothetical protein
MTDIMSLQFAAVPHVSFPPSSRYHGIETARLERPGQPAIVYLRRRFVPQPEGFAVLAEHVVIDGERLDHIAARHLGDPELFWRICDTNRALRPDDLPELGRRLVITLPEGVSGPQNV